jgi:HlyD family secretion protein
MLEVRSARSALAANATPGVRESFVVVRSPANGRVLRVIETSERIVPAGAPILEVGDPCDLELVVDVLSTDAVRIVKGARVDLAGWGEEETLRGTVSRVEPSAFTRVSALGVDEQRVNVIVSLIDAPASLGDGYRLDASIVIWEGTDRLVVPASAVFRSPEGWSVFVANNGRAARRQVALGHRSTAHVEIASGLAENDVVVLFPSDRLEDGSRLRLR